MTNASIVIATGSTLVYKPTEFIQMVISYSS